MKTYQKSFKHLEIIANLEIGFDPDLILLFVSPGYKHIGDLLVKIKEQFPTATVTGCSTSGEIMDVSVNDDTAVFNALRFERTDHKLVSENIKDFESSFDLGQSLIKKLEVKKDLRHVLVFSDGLLVNGDELVAGFKSELSSSVGITGGLAGDGSDFQETFVIKNDQTLAGEVVAVGLYGLALQVGYGSKGGWNSFGIERSVTKSAANVLYEIDNEPALELYKSYLKEQSELLPSAGLLFPLSMRTSSTEKPLVRTLLSINEEEQSITFAGNIPQGSSVRLMKANVDRLINGAEDSAYLSKVALNHTPEFALLVSCVGRRLVLKQLVEEEVEAVRDVLGDKPIMTGFYSYGELAPFEKYENCQLHNQTMTITTFSES